MTLRTMIQDCDICGKKMIKSFVRPEGAPLDDETYVVTIGPSDGEKEDDGYDVCSECVSKVYALFKEETDGY